MDYRELSQRQMHTSQSTGNVVANTLSNFQHSKLKFNPMLTTNTSKFGAFTTSYASFYSPRYQQDNRYSLISNFSEYYKHKKSHNYLVKNLPRSQSALRSLVSTKQEYSNFNKSCRRDIYGVSNEIEDKEFELLLDCYKEGHYPGKGRKEFKVRNKEDKKELFKKLKIQKQVNKEEKEKLWKVVRNSQFKRSGSISISSIPQYVNPVKSFKVLKINQQLKGHLMNKIGEEQIKKYLRIHFEKEQERLKIKLMPKVTMSYMDPNRKSIVGPSEMIKNEENIHDAKKFSILTETNVKNPTRADLFKEFESISVKYVRNYKSTPNTRSQASLVLYFPEPGSEVGKLILYGGISNERLSDLWICDIENNSYRWSQMKPCGEKPAARSGHTAVVYRKEMFIYGGVIENDTIYTPKEDILIYDIGKNKFSEETCYNKTNLKWRKGHSSEAVGYHMLVFGGMDDSGSLLNDTWILDLHCLRWIRLETKGVQVPPRYGHSSCLCVAQEKRDDPGFSMLKVPELCHEMKRSTSIRIEGVYLFGGIDQEGNCRNDVYVMPIGVKPLEWIKPKISGKPPPPRMDCSMNFYEKLNYVIIHGGRNDKYKDDAIFNDIYILDLEILQWNKLTPIDKSYPPQPIQRRCEHSSAVINNTLIIFGGISEQSYVKADLMLLGLQIFENKSKSKYFTAIDSENNLSQRFVLPERNENINFPTGENVGESIQNQITESVTKQEASSHGLLEKFKERGKKIVEKMKKLKLSSASFK